MLSLLRRYLTYPEEHINMARTEQIGKKAMLDGTTFHLESSRYQSINFFQAGMRVLVVTALFWLIRDLHPWALYIPLGYFLTECIYGAVAHAAITHTENSLNGAIPFQGEPDECSDMMDFSPSSTRHGVLDLESSIHE